MMYSEKKFYPKITLGQRGNSLVLLIAICLIVFVGLAFMKAIYYFRFEKDLALPLFNKNVMGLFALPANTTSLLYKPWTLITHMFVHENIWKVITNMLWLWCFGYIMQDMTGNKRIIPIFVYGCLGAAIAFLLAYQFIPSLHAQQTYATTMGASAGVMAIAIAATLVSPTYKIFPLLGGGIPLWGLTAFYVVSSLLTVSFSETATMMMQLAGALSGFLFIYFLRKGYDGGAWMNNFFDWVNNLFNPDKPKKGTTIKEELFYKTGTKPFIKTPNVTQQRIDAILDKINHKGYDALTEEEKDLLRRASKEGL